MYSQAENMQFIMLMKDLHNKLVNTYEFGTDSTIIFAMKQKYVITFDYSSTIFLPFIYMYAEDGTDKWLYLEFTSKNQ